MHMVHGIHYDSLIMRQLCVIHLLDGNLTQGLKLCSQISVKRPRREKYRGMVSCVTLTDNKSYGLIVSNLKHININYL